MIKWLSVITIFVFLILSVVRSLDIKEPLYCWQDIHIEEPGIETDECMILKITNQEYLNTKVLENLTCSDKLSDVPLCTGNYMYYSKYSLKLFCKDCVVNGFVCVGSWVDYYNSTYKGAYELRYLEYWNGTSEELMKKVITCTGERDG